MSHHHPVERVGRAGWFAIGALAASMAFVLLLIVGDYFGTAGSGSRVEAQMPTLVIEGN